jgi:translocation and assembly module TamB
VSGGRSRWRWLLVPLLLLLALPVALLGLLSSSSGTEWLLRQAAELARPAGIELSFELSAGNMLGRLELRGLVFAGMDTRVQIDRLVLDWRPRALLERRVHVRAFEVAGVRLTPPPASESEPEPLQIPDLRLPLVLQLDRLLVEQLMVEQPDGPLAVERLAASASLDQDGLVLRDLQFAGAGARLEGGLGLQAIAPHVLSGELTAHVDSELSGDAIGPVTARLSLSGQALRPAFGLVIEAPARLNLRGTLALDRQQPGFDLAADWDELSWPLHGEPQVTARDGRLGLEGSVGDYRITLQTALHGGELEPGDITLSAHGDLLGLELRPLTVRVQDGSLQADGSLRWDAGLRWQLEVFAERLNPGLFLPRWPGEIGGRLDVSGSLDEAGERLAVRSHIEDVRGQLRGYPVSASGTLGWDAGRLLADALKIASGPNRIDLDGRVDEQIDLRFAIDAPDLASLYPGLQGRLQGDGQFGGTPARPTGVGRLTGGGLGYQGLSARRFTVDVDWGGEGGTGKVRIEELDLDGVVLNSFVADLAGSPAEHRLDLNADGPEFAVALNARGGLRQQTWQGELRALTMQQDAPGEWRLRDPSALRLAANEVRSGKLCLIQGGSEVCANGAWRQVEGLDLSGSVHELRLAKLAAFAPGEAKVQGHLSAEFSAQGPLENPKLVFDLRPSRGRVRLEGDGQQYDLVFRNVRVNGLFENDRGSVDLRLLLAENGRAEGRVTLGAREAGDRALGGEVRVDFPDLALVEGFVPALGNVRGRLKVEATLGGTLNTPRVVGRLEVSDGSAQVRDAGIEVEDIVLIIEGDGGTPLRVDGRASSGEGRLDIQGTVDLATEGGPRLDLKVSGEDFEAARLPEARVVLSPDLTLSGQGPYHLSGTLRIPSAAIEVEELPKGTVEVSPDEIVVGETEEPTETGQAAAAPSNLTARVRIELGDAVNFKGFGLSTRLVGALDAAADARSTTVDGRIEMRDGRYAAYGQELGVELGRLLFSGPPGNPSVDLRAVRVSRDGDVRAYLALSGPLAKPRARVYSEPALPEAEAVAYLLTGRGLDRADQQEGFDIASAAFALGMSQGDPLLQNMSGRLGLDDLRVETGSAGLEDSSLVLGKYLNPNLYLGYSQGLFSPEGAVLLRMRLTDRLEFESRSGIEQSFDLLYRIEHD